VRAFGAAKTIRKKDVLQQFEVGHAFDAEEVASALAALPDRFGTDYKDAWLSIMFAVHHGSKGSEEGWRVLDEWSRRFKGYNASDNRKLWNEAKDDREKRTTIATLFHHAKENGWVRSRKPVKASMETATGKIEFNFPVQNVYKKPADHVRNIEHFLDRMQVRPWFNEFDSGYYLDGYERGDRLDDAALRDLRMQMHGLDCRVSVELLESAIKWVADQNARHPLREYLDKCEREWDGVSRLDTWLSDYVGAKDTKFARAAGRAFLIGAVRRTREPGCLARAMLVLEGPQNVGKSTVFKVLAGERQFSDSLPLGADAKEVRRHAANGSSSFPSYRARPSGKSRKSKPARRAHMTQPGPPTPAQRRRSHDSS
jgi:hypothetical protein